MENKLTLREIAPYLPYGLEVIYEHTKYRGVIRNLYDIEEYDNIKLGINWFDGEHIWMFKPILRPLSDLMKKEYRCLFYGNPLDYKIDELPYRTFTKLLELHFDVFHLIPQGLAIDKNKLAQLK